MRKCYWLLAFCLALTAGSAQAAKSSNEDITSAIEVDPELVSTVPADAAVAYLNSGQPPPTKKQGGMFGGFDPAAMQVPCTFDESSATLMVTDSKTRATRWPKEPREAFPYADLRMVKMRKNRYQNVDKFYLYHSNITFPGEQEVDGSLLSGLSRQLFDKKQNVIFCEIFLPDQERKVIDALYSLGVRNFIETSIQY